MNADQIVKYEKFKHSGDGFKYFIGYKEGEIVKSLCIILPQMSGYIKHFENGGKNMVFGTKDNNLLQKYKKIWNKVKKTLNIKFCSMTVFDKKYIKAKIREFNSVIKKKLFRWWNTKRKCTLRLHSLYKYWFCYENEKNELFTSLFRRIEVQDEKDKDA